MVTCSATIHSPSLNITESVVGFDNQPLRVESADKTSELESHYVAHYNFLKYKGATDWQATVTVSS
jgi:hypothetical protein